MALLTNDIYVGSVSDPLYHFTNANAELSGFKGSFALDVIGNELSIDQFSVVVRPDDNVTDIKNFLMELPYGTPVWWYVDGSFYAKGYLKSRDRVQKNGFRLTCVSGVGLLDTTMHVGGIYVATPITTVLASAIGGAFSYTVSQAVQNVLVYGRLPYAARRSNLHQILFSTGAALIKGDANTDYVIDFLSDSITDVPASRVSIQGSVNYQLPSNRVEITEHAYFYDSSVPTETLFDNTAETAADNLTVVFESPVYVSTLATTGTLTISESGVNYAVVSGQGTLTGKYYTHTTNLRVLTNNPNNERERVRRVENCELVTAINSLNVARRVLSYYQSAKTVKAKLLVDGERCGQLIRMTDAFGDLTQAYMAKMDTLVTSVIGAQCQLIEGFQPGSGGNVFTHRLAVDRAYIAAHGNTMLMPADYVKIVVIGGGNGGNGGYDGEEGQYKYKGTHPIWDPGEGGEVIKSNYIIDDFRYLQTCYYDGQTVASGGAGNNAGSRGKVYAVERSAVVGETITFNIGVGGAGGARNGGAGSVGTPTTVSAPSIGTISSESGLAAAPYFDPFTGDAYALAGIAGIAGGSGGAVDTVSDLGNNGASGLPGAGISGFAGGAGGSGMTISIRAGSTYTGYLSGGGGGGAAYGSNGGAGGNVTVTTDVGQYHTTYYGSGVGGAGANALPHPKPTYGSGGGGGNGGGGGGNCGGVKNCFRGFDNEDGAGYAHVGGAAGQGSVGGEGGDGVAIIYW